MVGDRVWGGVWVFFEFSSKKCRALSILIAKKATCDQKPGPGGA